LCLQYHNKKKKELIELKKKELQRRKEQGDGNVAISNEEIHVQSLPEWRIPPMALSAVFVPLGLMVYGWSAQSHLYVVIPDTGIFLFTLGLLPGFNCPSAYITDAYGREYTASAGAIGAFMRTMCGFSFPLFAKPLFRAIGLGKGFTLLACLTLFMGTGPLSMWIWGKQLREASWRGIRDAKHSSKDVELAIGGRIERGETTSSNVKNQDKTEDGKARGRRRVRTTVRQKNQDSIIPEGEIVSKIGNPFIEETDTEAETICRCGQPQGYCTPECYRSRPVLNRRNTSSAQATYSCSPSSRLGSYGYFPTPRPCP
jgi:hypothetical protein